LVYTAKAKYTTTLNKVHLEFNFRFLILDKIFTQAVVSVASMAVSHTASLGEYNFQSYSDSTISTGVSVRTDNSG